MDQSFGYLMMASMFDGESEKEKKNEEEDEHPQICVADDAEPFLLFLYDCYVTSLSSK
jgi:hypothetical protein